MIVKLLTEHHLDFLSLKGGCRGSSEPTIVKMSNCWKSYVTAHIINGPPELYGKFHLISIKWRLKELTPIRILFTTQYEHSKTCLQRPLKNIEQNRTEFY